MAGRRGHHHTGGAAARRASRRVVQNPSEWPGAGRRRRGRRVSDGVQPEPARREAEAPTSTTAAFAVYVLPQVEVLYRVARSLTGQPADAEDLVQDTLLRAFRAIEGFDGRHPRAWLLTILRNTEHNRHRRRRPVLLDDPAEADERITATP